MEPKTTLNLTAEITTLQIRTVRKVNESTFDVVFEGTAEDVRSAPVTL
jgi:hypothetical protein